MSGHIHLQTQLNLKGKSLNHFIQYSFSTLLTIGENKNLCFDLLQISPSFSSAIYRIDLQTGKRLPGTMWCSGHTVEAIIKDVNNDDKKDILAVGLDNGFEEQSCLCFSN